MVLIKEERKFKVGDKVYRKWDKDRRIGYITRIKSASKRGYTDVLITVDFPMTDKLPGRNDVYYDTDLAFAEDK